MRNQNPIATVAIGLLVLSLSACGKQDESTAVEQQPPEDVEALHAYVEQRLPIYASVTLESDLSRYSDNQKKMLAVLIDAAEIMDELFWKNAYGDKESLLHNLRHEPTRRFAIFNYGPWDRLNGDKPFVPGVGAKPPGANFYPADMTKEEFALADLPGKAGLYAILRRDEQGGLVVIPYSVAYREQLEKAAGLLRQAAALADNAGFKRYLELRAEALLTDDYYPSDLAWMEMKDNPIDLVYGPIETYEDKLFGYKASFEAYVLLKDMEWSRRLARFAQFLPELQDGLPVPDRYKAEAPGTDAELNAYDAIYYAGHSNAGSKTIAINLPNDERVQLEKGTRRLQLKNTMRAKFDKILLPIAGQLIAEDQRRHITFDAFFKNVMFHEVAHGLGIKNTLTGVGTVREALKEHASALEEAKADILGLYMITRLFEKGEFAEGELMDHYVTFLAGLFRSVRFGASSAHGRANMVQFNFFKERGAFAYDPDSRRYRVNFAAMQQAITDLSSLILTLQGDGDYLGAGNLLETRGVIDARLRADLDRLATANIPVDIAFNQGKTVLGLQ